MPLMAAAMNATSDSIVITDERGIIKWVNSAFTKNTGYAFSEAVGRNPRMLKSGKQSKDYYAEMWRTISSGQPWHGEFINKKKSGELFTEDVTVTPVRDDSGAIKNYVAIKFDVTERKRAQEELSLFRQLVDASEDSFEVVDPDTGCFLDISQGRLRKLGYSREEILRLHVWDIDPSIHPENWVGIVENLSLGGELLGEGQHRCKDGATFPIEYRVKLVRLERAYIITVTRDITKRKQLEEQVLRAQRLDCIGMLAVGISHDLNNILAPISMASALLKNQVSKSGDMTLLETVDKSVERGAGLVREIMAFARGIGGERSLVQVRHLLGDIKAMVTETFPKAIVLEASVPNDLWPVATNATQIHQVLLNLCVNARDAMPHGGVLRLRAENVVLDSDAASSMEGARPGRWLVLHVEDSGTGIEPQVLEQIWDPFFTTKTAAKGSGLGLSTTRGIVAAHQGFITVKTEVGRGTTFRVYLPVSEGEVAEGQGTGVRRESRGNGELILIVDDEESIREVASKILKRCNYQAITAANGREALAAFDAHKGKIALIITDSEMPIQRGAELARNIRSIAPKTRILAMSGHSTSSPFAVEWSDGLASATLRKPFTSEELMAKVGQILGAGHQ